MPYILGRYTLDFVTNFLDFKRDVDMTTSSCSESGQYLAYLSTFNFIRSIWSEGLGWGKKSSLFIIFEERSSLISLLSLLFLQLIMSTWKACIIYHTQSSFNNDYYMAKHLVYICYNFVKFTYISSSYMMKLI